MSVTLRPLEADNLQECLSLEIDDIQQNHGQVEETYDMVKLMVENPTVESWTVYSDETMVGFIAYTKNDETSDYQIARFLIDQKHQGRGYGESALRQAIAQIFDHADCERIVVNYMSFNEPAVKLYEKVGFVETAEFQEPDELDEHGYRYSVLMRPPNPTLGLS